MNPIERALGILLLLSSGKLVSATTLAERFDVSLRTIYRDIDRLIALGVPVDAERGAEGGYRLAKGYLHPPVALSRNETAALLSALALIRSIRTTPLATDLDAAERKLVASLPKAVHDLLSQADRIIGIEPVPADIFHAGTKAEPTGAWQRALDGFMLGLLESRRVRFDYANPSRQELRAHDVEPYGILFDRDLWYLAGRCVDTDILKIYRADRASDLEVSGFRFRPPKDFTVQSLLGGVWLSRAMRRWERGEAGRKDQNHAGPGQKAQQRLVLQACRLCPGGRRVHRHRHSQRQPGAHPAAGALARTRSGNPRTGRASAGAGRGTQRHGRSAWRDRLSVSQPTR